MRVLIVDDHPLFREGMETLLACLAPSVDVVGVASVAEALAVSQRGGDFDLVLLDMNLPGANHLEGLQRITEACERSSVVIVSAEDDPDLIRRTIAAGAAGFIPKSTDPDVVVNALRLVLEQGIYLPPGTLMNSASAPSALPAAPSLSERQQAVLRLLLQGKSNKLIARELNVAEGTVKAHLWTVYQLLGVSTRVQAMYRVYELGMLPMLVAGTVRGP